MKILSDRIYLRDVEEKDYDFFSKLETDMRCLRYEADKPHSKEYIENKFLQTMEDQAKVPRQRYRLMLCNEETNEPMGRIILWIIDEDIKEWEIGWDLYPDYWGYGYASEGAKLMLKFAFEELKVHRVQALCNHRNKASEKVMKNIDMTKEGILREVRLLNNNWDNSIIYSILKNEFKGMKQIK